MNPKMNYTHIAVLIHWVTAIVIIGLLAVGKYMTGLEPSDPLRFTLTQSHKTFGILILCLSVLRILWRLTHRAPGHPAGAPHWERLAAGVSHLLFYLLLIALPLSGWALVSVSSLNIDTLLFNRIEWPHLPLVEWLGINDTVQRDALEHKFHSVHHIAGNVLLVLLLVHISAALKHHFVDKDNVLRRMAPRFGERSFQALVAVVVLGIGAAAAGLNQLGNSPSAGLVAGGSSVSLQADVSGSLTTISFASSTVTANINTNSPTSSTLSAIVDTTVVSSDNLQVQGSLPDAEWLYAENYPQASFEATVFSAGTEPNTLNVDGNLTIKDTTQAVSFILKVHPETENNPATASAEFPIDRFDFELGLQTQPNDDYVNSIVLIRVSFELGSDS